MRVLEYLYTGVATIANKSDHVTEIIEVAKMFHCDSLVTICENILGGLTELNPSIGEFYCFLFLIMSRNLVE